MIDRGRIVLVAAVFLLFLLVFLLPGLLLLRVNHVSDQLATLHGACQRVVLPSPVPTTSPPSTTSTTVRGMMRG